MSGPLGEDRLLSSAEAAFGAGADGVQVLVLHSWGGLTRFASSRIHQNTWREDIEFRVLAVAGEKGTGVASTHSLDPGAVRRAAEAAILAPGFSCRHQIDHGTGRRAQHPIEVLAAAYGLEE